MKRRSVILLVFVVVLAAAACAAVWRLWPRAPEGLSRRTAEFGDRSVTFLVYRLPTFGAEYSLVGDPSNPRGVRQWREDLGAAVVFNGSYFNADNTPSGYWKTGKGTSAVPWPSREAQADPHGYTFSLTALMGGLGMRYLPNDPGDERVDETLLSFPTLLADGRPMVEADSGLRARRTAVAEDADGVDYAIVTEAGTLTLYELSRWLAEQPENFVVAGNLDGGPSTGISIENGGDDIDVLSAAVPNVVAIFTSE